MQVRNFFYRQELSWDAKGISVVFDTFSEMIHEFLQVFNVVEGSFVENVM